MTIWTRTSLAAARRVRRALEDRGYQVEGPVWIGGDEPWAVMAREGWEGEF